MSINWILLMIGGLFETLFAVSLAKAHQSSGKTFWLWLLTFALSVAISMYFLFRAMGGSRPIPVGTAYAVWGAIGVLGTVVSGILFFHEPVTFWRLFFLTTLLLSVLGLQLMAH